MHLTSLSPAALLIACSVTVIACTDRSAEPAAGLVTTIDTIGDTVRVRSAGRAEVLGLEPEIRIGSVDGDAAYQLARVAAIVEGPAGGIYVWDGRLAELRHYDSAGVFVRTLGRKGQGPGEYVNASGIAAVANGGVAIWDPQTARFTLFEADGTVRTSWRWQSSLIFAPHPLHTDTAGNIYVPALLPPPNGSTNFDDSRFANVRVRPDGRIVDTLVLPQEENTPMLRAERNGTSTGTPLPFAQTPASALTPWGTVARAHTARYAIDVPRAGESTILRIERDMDAVPVGDDERRDLAEAITRDMRTVDPTWRWSGPEIPRRKPHIRELIIARDGSIWVARSMPAQRRASADTTPGAPAEWIEPTTYDVFGPDGRLRGEVALPASTKLHLTLGDRVWAVQRDSLDVPTIVRFRVRGW